MRLQSVLLFLFFAGLLLLGSSCKKEKLLTSGGELRFSIDTLTFDTVFTQQGSFTLGLKIFNPQDQKVNISSVRLLNGSNSFFHLNVNGISGNNVTDLEVAANDSIYVFATVKINPNSDSIPFIVEDRLIATLNNNEFSIPVFAYGQNAHYIKDSVIQQSDIWLTDKPYVILHSALIEKGSTLTIPAGCRIYMHQDSRLYVRGTLIINGTKQDSVIFQGDRLDRGYFGNQGFPGEWGGIYFDSTSTGNKIEWTILKNCGNNSGGGLPFAIEVFGKPNIALQLTLNNTIIENSAGYGLLSFQGNIKAQNCLIYKCTAQALAILQGGNYQFDNCDFININRSDEPTTVVLNYFDISNTERLLADLTANFRNCLLYGLPNSNDVFDQNQIFIDQKGATNFAVSLENCLIENKDPITNALTSNCIFNRDSLFIDFEKNDFRPAINSSLIDNGVFLPTQDLNNITHNVNGKTDIGCYESD